MIFQKLLKHELVRLIGEKIVLTKERLKVIKSRQKSYIDNHWKELEFEIGDHIFLIVSAVKFVFFQQEFYKNKTTIYS